MKYYLSTLLIFIVLYNSTIYAQYDVKQFCENKIVSGQKMARSGSVLAVSGVCLTALGAGLIWASYSKAPDSVPEFEGYKFIGGIVSAAFGLDMIIGGTVIHSVGSHKVRKYQNRLENISIGFDYFPDKKEFKLTYRF